MTDNPVIQLQNVSYIYEGSVEPALQNIDFTVKQGEWLWVVGPNGSGKSTLCGLLCGIRQSWPGGVLQGEINRDLAGQVGVVFQDPEAGLIQEYVEDELAFGPENLGIAPGEIEQRIDDTLKAVHMSGTRKHRTDQLSGGQQQRISIASILTMRPQILILDDATANLDKAAARRLMSLLYELHQNGHTIITLSSRLDEDGAADRIIVLEQGHITADGPSEEVQSEYKTDLIRLGCSLVVGNEKFVAPISQQTRLSPIIQVQGLHFGYGEQSEKQVLRNLNIELYGGDFLAVLGPNGSGKTTFGKLLTGLLPVPAGSIMIHERDLTTYSTKELAQTVGYVFQNPDHQFIADTVLEECLFGLLMRSGLQLGSKESDQFIQQNSMLGENWLEKFGLHAHRSRNPYKLSIAEKKLLNLASVLILQPDLIVLDEPTAGLDYTHADHLMSYCADYAKQGKSIVMITHDVKTVKRWATKELVIGELSI